MEKKDKFSIHLTKKALLKIKNIFLSKKKKLRFRVYVTSGGCNGFQYGFILDDLINEEDLIIKKSGVELVIDYLSFKYINGGYIDYIEEIEGSYFIIKNPHAKSKCSCGFSFDI